VIVTVPNGARLTTDEPTVPLQITQQTPSMTSHQMRIRQETRIAIIASFIVALAALMTALYFFDGLTLMITLVMASAALVAVATGVFLTVIDRRRYRRQH